MLNNERGGDETVSVPAGLPTIFHVYAHYVPAEERSRAFGYLIAAGGAGQTVAAVVSGREWTLAYSTLSARETDDTLIMHTASPSPLHHRFTPPLHIATSHHRSIPPLHCRATPSLHRTFHSDEITLISQHRSIALHTTALPFVPILTVGPLFS